MARGQQKVKGGARDRLTDRPRDHPRYQPMDRPMIPESARAEFWATTSPRRVGLASCARRGAEGSFLCSLITDFLAEGAGWGASPGRGGRVGWQGGPELKKFFMVTKEITSTTSSA